MGKIQPSFKQLKAILAPMSWRDRMEYLWTYYKWVLVVVALIGVAVSIVVSSVRNLRVQSLYSGIVVGVNMTEEGVSYLSDDLQTLLGGDGEERVVDFDEVQYSGSDEANSYEANVAGMVRILAAVEEGSLDYLLSDQEAYDYYVKPSPFGDLRQILSAEQLEALEAYIVYSEEEDVAPYPKAIDITHTEFAKHCVPNAEVLYLAFPGTSSHSAFHSQFVDYLLAWQPKA